MQKRIFLEKKTEYAGDAGRMYHFITERLRLHAVSEVRLLRCLLIDGWKDAMDVCLPKTVYMDERTEQLRCEEDVRRDAQQNGVLCISTVSLFRHPAETLTEAAIRTILGDSSIGYNSGMGSGISCRQADIILLKGDIPEDGIAALRRYFINPASEAEIDLWASDMGLLPPAPTDRSAADAVLRGFRQLDSEALALFMRRLHFHMTEEDMRFVQSYFTVEEKRDPTILEVRMIDIYWSDHCRHITFLTALQELQIEDPVISASFESYLSARESLYGTRPKNITLMDIATLPEKYFRREGRLLQHVETGEKNACTMRVGVRVTRRTVPSLPDSPKTVDVIPWLLHFKNETHNYATEHAPYLGAAASFGATICDPLSARGEVFAAMRLSGSSFPDDDSRKTFFGRQPQYKMSVDSADGFASYGAQCGVPVGYAREWLNEGFAARHMEVCLTAAAVPESEYHAGKPIPGDVILLVGAPTGRDGMGGALTASASGDFFGESAGSTVLGSGRFSSPVRYTVPMCDAQIGRALLRLMRNPALMRCIKRASDVGAGGIGVAAGELADGVRIDLDHIPTGADDFGGRQFTPYEIAVSETLGRLLLVVPSIHAPTVLQLAEAEDLSAHMIGIVTAERRFRMVWHERTVLSLSRDFLDSNGAEKRIGAYIPMMRLQDLERSGPAGNTGADLARSYVKTMMQSEVRSQKSLLFRMDQTAGGRMAFLPFGGRRMLTPLDFMAVRMPVGAEEFSETCAVFSYGYLPSLSEKSPYHGGYYAVLEAVCRMAAAGISIDTIMLSLQEYFPAVEGDPVRYGVPLASMLGAFQAQMDLGIAAIGGKDSMSGTDEAGDVPPTLIAFAVSAAEQSILCTPEMKKSGSRVYLLSPTMEETHLPDTEDMRGLFAYLASLHVGQKILSCMAVGAGGIAATVAQMCFGNQIGFNFENSLSLHSLFEARYGAFLVETDSPLRGQLIGYTKDTANLLIGDTTLPLTLLFDAWQKPQEKMYRPTSNAEDVNIVAGFPCRSHRFFSPAVAVAHPRVLLPIFPGTNGEDVLGARFAVQGFEVKKFLFRCRTPQERESSIQDLCRLLSETNILALSGGSYSAKANMPDPTAAFVGALFADVSLAEMLRRLRERDDVLFFGIGEGFAELLAMGAFALPAIGRPVRDGGIGISLTENLCGSFASQMVRVKVMSTASPWMRFSAVGDVYTLPIASRAGRCLLPDDTVLELAAGGQIAAQYVDADGNPTMDRRWNPFSSEYAVEGVFSADGRVYGRMAHCDRVDNTLCVNVPGNKLHDIFRAAMEYYKIN